MKNVYLFFPENDLALAADNANYTPPAAATALHVSGEMLPLWYGNPGDMVICNGVNDCWLSTLEQKLGVAVTPYDFTYTPDMVAAPWGWSAASRKIYRCAGFPDSALPSDETLREYRALSHRRTAIEICDTLAALLPFSILPPGRETSDIKEVLDMYRACGGRVMVKLPWSSSGRGTIPFENTTEETLIKQCAPIIRRNGSVIIEPVYERLVDFAMIYRLKEDGAAQYQGLSVFTVNSHQGYENGILAPESALREIITAHYPADHLESVRQALGTALSTCLGKRYTGLLGVDMFVALIPADNTPVLHAVVEINLRMSMGMLCSGFYNRYVSEGLTGTFRVCPSPLAPPEQYTCTNSRISSGCLHLTPPGNPLTFIADFRDHSAS